MTESGSQPMLWTAPFRLRSIVTLGVVTTACIASVITFNELLTAITDLLKAAVETGSLYKEWPIYQLEKFLARECKDAQSQAMYSLMDQGAPIQLGALGDPFDDLELHSGWAKKAIPLFIKYKQPVRISTKGGRVLQMKEYLDLFAENPRQFWVAWSINCNDDERIAKVDINAPVTSERLKAMKALTDIGVHAA